MIEARGAWGGTSGPGVAARHVLSLSLPLGFLTPPHAHPRTLRTPPFIHLALKIWRMRTNRLCPTSRGLGEDRQVGSWWWVDLGPRTCCCPLVVPSSEMQGTDAIVTWERSSFLVALCTRPTRGGVWLTVWDVLSPEFGDASDERV